jgi:pimeloyl-ACP methyl ester carboxylesterase
MMDAGSAGDHGALGTNLKRTVRTSDGRRLATAVHGDPEGRPVFLLHGTPGSRIGPKPRSAILHRLGVRLICFDRPGYGESDRLPGRRVADAAADVAAIADAFGLAKFAVVGRSGGGPHALACAALLPERVTKAAVLVSVAPREAEGLDWLDGMTEWNLTEYGAMAQGYERIAAVANAAADAVRANPASLLAKLHGDLPDSDRRVVADPGIRSLLLATYAEGLRTSAHGWIDDDVAFHVPWGFDLATVTIPVLLWHGAGDTISPVSHVRWLAEHIPDPVVVVQAGAAHFGSLDVLPDILRWVTADEPAAGSPHPGI